MFAVLSPNGLYFFYFPLMSIGFLSDNHAPTNTKIKEKIKDITMYGKYLKKTSTGSANFNIIMTVQKVAKIPQPHIKIPNIL